jgi:hypothetical protein
MISLVTVIVFLTLNPYVSFLPLSSDTQPLCLVFQIIFLLNNRSAINLVKPLRYICFSLSLIFVISLFSAGSLDSIGLLRGLFHISKQYLLFYVDVCLHQVQNINVMY